MRARRWRRSRSAPYSTKDAGVEQVVDVLARGALAGLAPARDGVGPLVVERHRLALEILGEIGPDVVEVDLLLDRARRSLDIGLLDEQQRMAFEDRIAAPRPPICRT